MNNDEDKNKIKKELEELKKRNQELEKMIKSVFNRIDKINGAKKSSDKIVDDLHFKKEERKVEELLEKDILSLKEKKINQSYKDDISPVLEERKHGGRDINGPLRGPLPPEEPRPLRGPLPPEDINGPTRKHLSLSKEEIARAREEIRRAKEELRRERERLRYEARRKALESAKKSNVKPFMFSKNIDLEGFGETISKYVESILSSVSRNIEETVKSAFSTEKSANSKSAVSNSFSSNKKANKFVFPYDYRRIPIEEIESYLDEISELLSAIGDKNRLHILKLLELHPEYQKELSEKTGLRGGTFKHHTDILAKNGLITQETVRGRYLITQLGIEALKLAEILYSRKQELYSPEELSSEKEDDDEINIDIN